MHNAIHPSAGSTSLAAMTRFALAFLLCAMFGQAFAQGISYTRIERGRYLVKVGDCAACHTVKGGAPFAGGLPISTPFGTIYSTNITPDQDTGLGKWSDEDFYRAMHFGERRDGKALFPAFPFPWFTKLSRDDVMAIKAYLNTVPAVKQQDKPTELFGPLNWRVSAAAWKMLFFHPGEYKPNPQKTDEWNRGAYLVDGGAHCAACHTAKNLFGAAKTGSDLLGGDAGDSWYAPSLGRGAPDGLGGWTTQDIVTYLKTGANHMSAAAGPMNDVIMRSTQHLSDADLKSMAVYLQDLPADHTPRDQNNQPAASSTAEVDKAVLERGQGIYVDNCIGCHMVNGAGQPGAFPPLKGNPSVMAAKADSVIQIVFGGGAMAAPRTKPTGLEMPAYAWKLSDGDAADLVSYIRNAWGNRASAVDSGKVAAVRKQVVKIGGGRKGMVDTPY